MVPPLFVPPVVRVVVVVPVPPPPAVSVVSDRLPLVPAEPLQPLLPELPGEVDPLEPDGTAWSRPGSPPGMTPPIGVPRLPKSDELGG
jgi:hypothetical protein